MYHAIKQLEEKTCTSEVIDMVWSDRMDLVAISNLKGEVSLHRLTWNRAWIVSSPKKDVRVDAMAWRPDGKVIAITYNTGKVYLISVENKVVLQTVETHLTVSCLHWIQEKVEQKPHDPRLLNETEEANDYMKYIDFSAVFLSDPSPTIDTSNSTTTDEAKKPHTLQTQTELNLLLIGTKEGMIFINVFGCFQCVELDLKEYIGMDCSIENIHLSEDLSRTFVTVRDCEGHIKIVCFDSTIFKTHTKELFAIAMKYVCLQHLGEFMSTTISTIKETWESILLEMDTKLSNYASKVAEGGVTADFLDLLMFGFCSPELEEFLLKDLTKKGLEKFGQTIEVSYSNIQKLLIKYIIKFGQNITYQLAELRGMARLKSRYEVFGLTEGAITEAIQSAGMFLIKACEVQQIINQSIINYKAFIRWLYTAIMHLMDEQIPSEIPKMTQQDLAYITEFLQNFDHIGHKNEPNKKGFVMERIGQYLADTPLTIPPNMEGNEWTNFLEQNQCLKENPYILKHDANTSLVQQYYHMKSTVYEAFTEPRVKVGQHMKLLKTFDCFECQPEKLRMSQINLNKDNILYAFVQPSEYLDLFQICDEGNQIRHGRFAFPQYLSYDQEANGENYQLLDAKFYSATILSLLLQETSNAKTAVIYQFPIPETIDKLKCMNTKGTILESNPIEVLNGSNVFPKLFKNIEGMVASQFAVSGSRRVSVVLADNRRKVRLFEMEGEEEDDEDADMTSSTIRESDVSMQESGIIE